MAEPKRYEWKFNGGDSGMFSTEDGLWVSHDDYTTLSREVERLRKVEADAQVTRIRLERERDKLEGALEREQYETARQAEELARLRTVEAAANLAIDADISGDGMGEALDVLAEACGRKG